ncbi:MAG: hypothetical protein EP332_10130 [Bacteroidetes bacterium]|nr:MAG: hypothetical protein EP332_10130 [Bacteroidota bacterium]
MSLYFDPYAEFPYFLRIMSPERDQDEILNYRREVLQSIGLWDTSSPIFQQLAEVKPFGIYTELIHRDKGVAGFCEFMSYENMLSEDPTYFIAHYYASHLKATCPDLNFHVRSLYLKPEFQRNGSSFLYMCYLNCHYAQLRGAKSMSFSTNADEDNLVSMYQRMGAAGFSDINAEMTEKFKVWVGHFSVDTVINPLRRASLKSTYLYKNRAQLYG